jgi:antitoxin CptB
MENSAELPPSALRWRCRRGMRELDVLLGRWLSERWDSAEPAMRAAFADLLDREDDQIWDWLMGRVPPDTALAPLIDDIGSLSARSRD